MAVGLLSAFFTDGRVSAEPVILQDASQQIAGIVDPTESILEPAASAFDGGVGPGRPGRTGQATGHVPGGLARADRARSPSLEITPTKVAPKDPAITQTGVSPGPDLTAEIRSTVKESVRPLHDQLVESGALDTWKELKSDLGLDKGKWDTDGTSAANPSTTGRDASDSPRWKDAPQPPKTAAQAQIDRELASHMMEKLIDEVKPWALSLLAIYLLGYLIKAGIEYSQRKSIRRRERQARRILRQASSKAASTKPEA